MELKIPPPVYLLIFGAAMWWLADALPILSWEPGLSLSLGWALAGCGVLIDLSALWRFIQAKTTINPHRPMEANALVVEGMYRFTRNPMYLGMLLLLCGWALVLASLSSFLLVPLFVVLLTQVQIKPEEIALVQLFGDEYQEYQKNVRRWL